MIPAKLLPAGTLWFIAGGYAACPALATDIDVWVSCPDDEVEETRLDLLKHLLKNGLKYKEQIDGRLQLITKQRSDHAGGFNDYQHHLNIRKVADVMVPGTDKPFHIMVVNGTIEDVLSGFDISTHQVAINSNGQVSTGPGWTPLWVYPQLLQNVNDKTEARMKKIAERYGHVYREPVPA